MWACASPEGPALEAFLGPHFDDDLAGIGLEHHALVDTRVHEREANWKLVFDAFAEGYHVNSLHRTSVARYFSGAALVDALGLHVRQIGARKNLAVEWEGFDLRDQTTVFYNLFPNGVLVYHPTWIMHLNLEPLGPRRVRVVHRMLVDRRAPQDPDAVIERARSFVFIDEKIIQAEDLSICESLQRNLDGGRVDEVLLGAREEGMRLFHAARERWLVGERSPEPPSQVKMTDTMS